VQVSHKSFDLKIKVKPERIESGKRYLHGIHAIQLIRAEIRRGDIILIKKKMMKRNWVDRKMKSP
jgi:hypothetical protein